MKTALVTGGNRGFGLAFISTLLERGYFVFGTARNVKDVPLNHKNLTWLGLDVTDDASISAAAERVRETNAELHVLVNNAGVNRKTASPGGSDIVSKLGCLERSKLQYMFNVNALGPLMITERFLPLLKSTPSYAINIGSSRGTHKKVGDGTTGNYGYAMSKASLHIATRCLAREVPENIRIFAFNPGRMSTRMRADGENPQIRAVQCLEIMDKWQPHYQGSLVHWDGSLCSL